ncbi:unnamed protein product [Pleuronectes platessa]|uniref:Uncharacterized protein n=1 Tax=Pleuronectes platessa TaxID=8262 RepID=A0A9N7U3G0_PLEPL|nr:unnamed protein product [Pleuronectes platessa]
MFIQTRSTLPHLEQPPSRGIKLSSSSSSLLLLLVNGKSSRSQTRKFQASRLTVNWTTGKTSERNFKGTLIELDRVVYTRMERERQKSWLSLTTVRRVAWQQR